MKKTMVVIMFLVSGLFCIFAKGGSENDVIKIGVAGPHSGDLAPYGLPTVSAVKFVAGQYNDQGGILGRQIELIIEDDVCKPEVASNTASKILSDGVVAVIGHICSGATKSALSVYKEAGIPTISPAATKPSLTESLEYPNFLRTIAPDSAQAETLVNFIIKNLGNKIALIHDKQDYGKGLADFSVSHIEEMGGEVVFYEGITAGDQDYSSVLRKLSATDADLLLYGGYHAEATRLVQQMKQIGLDIPFVSGDGVKGVTFIELARENAEGVYASGPIDTSSNPLAMEARKMYEEKYNETPGSFYLNAYAASIALFEAIKKAESTESEAIIRALKSNEFDTPIGMIGFDEIGDVTGTGFSVYEVQNGQYVQL